VYCYSKKSAILYNTIQFQKIRIYIVFFWEGCLIVQKEQYNVRLPKDIINRVRLIPQGKRNCFISDAIQAALNYEDQSISIIDWKINDLKAQIQVLQQTKDKKIAEEKRKRKNQSELEELYNQFCDYAKYYTSGYNTVRVNKKYKINLTGWPQFEGVIKSVKAGNFSIDDFKELKEGC